MPDNDELADSYATDEGLDLNEQIRYLQTHTDPNQAKLFVGRYVSTEGGIEQFDSLTQQELVDLLVGRTQEGNRDAINEAVIDLYGSGFSEAPPQPSHVAADPVELFSGEFVHEAEDLVVSGAGLDFVFARTYRHKAVHRGPVGANWDHSYNISLRIDDTEARLWTGAVREEVYARHPRYGEAGFSYYVPPDGTDAIIEPVGDPSAPGQWARRSPDGMRHLFSSDVNAFGRHQLDRIEDRHGNYLAFGYDSDEQLVRVDVNHPDRAVQLAYDSEGRIVAVQDHTGRRWRYDYDHHGDLVAVTTPNTAEHPAGVTTCFEYSTPHVTGPLRHNLTVVYDGAGRRYLENRYGTAPGRADYNRVVWQRLAHGDSSFRYEPIIVTSGEYAIEHRPVMRAVMTDRNGHQKTHIYNAFGSLLRHSECVLEGGHRELITHWRYNRDGKLLAMLSPEGVITQYLYGRDQYLHDHAIDDDDVGAHEHLSAAARQGFGRLLATVRRARYFTSEELSWTTAYWGDVFPDIRSTEPADIIVKRTYESVYGQALTVSDARATASADPHHSELADYDRLLTTFEYDGPPGDETLLLRRIVHPAPTAPDGTPGAPIVEAFEDYDTRGRLLAARDAVGTLTRFSYVDGSAEADPADRVKDGFLVQTIVDADGLALTTRSELDRLGRSIATILPRAAGAPDGYFVNHAAYDELDQVVLQRTSAPLSYEVRDSHDATGAVVRTERDWITVDDDGIEQRRESIVQTWCYDEELHPLQETIGGTASPALVTHHRYDAAGQLTATMSPGRSVVSFEYDSRGLLVASTRQRGTASTSTTRVRYDGDGRAIATIDARGNTTHIELDALGRIVVVADPLGNIKHTSYDKTGNAVVERSFEARGDSHVLLARTEHDYDELGRRVRTSHNVFDEPLAVTDLATDYLESPGPGRLISVTTFHDAAGRVTRIVDALGRATLFAYDTVGRNTVRTDPLGNETRTSYDAHGNPIRRDVVEIIRDPNTGDPTGQRVFPRAGDYDELDREIRGIDSLGNITSLEYDSLGRAVRTTDPLGNVVHTDYDVYGRQISVTEQRTDTGLGNGALLAPAVVRSEYDRNGNQVALIDARENRTEYRYDKLNRRTQTIYADGSAVRVFYDADDNVFRVREANGVQRRISVDALGRRTSVSIDRSEVDAGLAIEGDTERSFAYDGLGRLLRDENEHAINERRYNSVGWPLEDRMTVAATLGGQPDPYIVHREFDDAGARAATVYPNGRRVELDRDSLGRLARVRNTATGAAYPGSSQSPEAYDIATFSYTGRQRGGIEYGNDTTVSHAYDGAGRLIEREHRFAGGANLRLQYLHDGAANPRFRIDARGDSAEAEEFAYDSEGQLVSARDGSQSVFDPAVFGPLNHIPGAIDDRQAAIDAAIGNLAMPADPRWHYDLAGNRTSEATDDGLVEYTSNPLNQYVAVDGAARTYDPSGNLLRDAWLECRYDANHRLVRVLDAVSGDDVERYYYDGQGRRVAEQTPVSTGHLVADGGKIVAEYREGALSAQYVFDDGLDAPLQLATGGADHFYHTDALGSVRALSNASSAVTTEYRYDPFGGTRDETSGGITNVVRYAGRRLNAETGTYDYRARQYDPAVGQFLQRDPLGTMDGPNLYSYVGNSPQRFVDPAGLARSERATVVELKRSGWVGVDPEEMFELRDPSVSGGLEYAFRKTLEFAIIDPLHEALRDKKSLKEEVRALLATAIVAMGTKAIVRGVDALGKWTGKKLRQRANVRPSGAIKKTTVAPDVSDATRGGTTFSNKFPDHEVGTPLQTYSPGQLKTKTGRINYVVTEDGTLVLGRRSNEVGGGHIDLAGGRPVQAAGEIKVVRGDVRSVDNASGHYEPSGADAQSAAEAAFQKAGIDISGKYVDMVWDGQKWVAK